MITEKRRYWMRLASFALFAFFLTIVGTIIWFSYTLADAYVHPQHRKVTTELLDRENIQYQNIELTTSDGIQLKAWYTPPKNGAVILVAHGYADKRSEDFHALFASHGYGVLAWDFRGHGESGGDTVTLGYYEVRDVEAALDYVLTQPGVKHIGAWGGSMGAVTVIRAAAQRSEIEAVVADSPFSTLEDEFKIIMPYPIIRPLIRFFAERETGLNMNLVRPVDDISRISPRPVFIIQGMSDKNIPVDSAQRLYDAARDPRLLWTEPNAPHMNMYAYYRTRYTNKVIKFFNIYLLK